MLCPRQRLYLLLTAALSAAPLIAAPKERFVFVDPAAPEAASVRQPGEAAAAVVATRLITELTTALEAGGPEKAVETCHIKAQPLTNEPIPSLPQIVAVKRTSLRLRNPANAPDAAERAALDHLAALTAAARPPPGLLIQKIETDGAAAEWRVYRPVFAQPQCLACHGNPETQSPALRRLLRERYPQDAATGYAAGDWRGLLRLTVRPAAGNAATR
ncbi:MAG: DUF3365 domain-containing protein [Verrucomicrobia bacterium]|nr:DUF3365 domain-containing protein [Verrucomicrobiota bacterium]